MDKTEHAQNSCCCQMEIQYVLWLPMTRDIWDKGEETELWVSSLWYILLAFTNE